jgi:hypothetical protein
MRFLQLLILGALLAAPAIAAAQPAQLPEARRSTVFVLDNDFLALRGAGKADDFDYTHGAKISVSWLGAPDLVRRALFAKRTCDVAGARQSTCLATGLELGQRIYTPRRAGAQPVEGERPYGGWLYVAGSAKALSPHSALSMDIEIGMTGKGSLAEPVQAGMHKILGNTKQPGWAHQLETNPGMLWRIAGARRYHRAVRDDLVPAVTVNGGMVNGDLLRLLFLGADATLDIGESVPWTLSEPEIERPGRVYLRAGYRQEYVGANAFVEGREGGSADRRKFVGQFQGGVGYRRPAFRMEYRHTIRGREYDAQPKSHMWGSLSFAVNRY